MRRGGIVNLFLLLLILAVTVAIGVTGSYEQIFKQQDLAVKSNFSIVQVSQDTPEANEIFISRGGDGTFYMGWNDYRDVDWSNGYVHLGFSYSTDGGHTWSDNYVLGNTTDNDFHDAAGDPVVVGGDGSTVYYVMMEFNSSEANQNSLAHSQIVVRKSTDNGQTWSDEVRLWPYDVDNLGPFTGTVIYTLPGTTSHLDTWNSPTWLTEIFINGRK